VSQSFLADTINTDKVCLKNITPLKIFYQNCQGIRQHINSFKLAVIENDFDIIALTETFLYPQILNSEIFDCKTYNVFRKDRCSCKEEIGGGVLLAVNSKFITLLQSVPCLDTEQLIVTLKLSNNKSMLFSLSYIVPASSEDIYKLHLDNIHHCIELNNIDNDSILIVGDFNLPSLKWTFISDEQAVLPFNVTSKAEILFIDSISELNLIQINNVPNHYGKFLDLVFVPAGLKSSLQEAENLVYSKDKHHKSLFFVSCLITLINFFVVILVTLASNLIFLKLTILL